MSDEIENWKIINDFISVRIKEKLIIFRIMITQTMNKEFSLILIALNQITKISYV